MARSPSTTPRKTTAASTQQERVAKRLARQTKQLEKEIIGDTIAKITANSGRMVKLSDLRKLQPLTQTQSDVFSAWEDAPEDNVGFVLSGFPGVGKSFIAMYLALKEVLDPESKYKKLIICRSCVPTREIGALPGTLELKGEVYEEPYMQICSELTNDKFAYEKLKNADKIEFVTTSFLRSLTFNNSIVFVDEIQSCNWHEINTICTRLGKNSKLIVAGDYKQNDLVYKKNDVSGFKEFLKVSSIMPEFRTFSFTMEDIIRSGFVRSWVIACDSVGL